MINVSPQLNKTHQDSSLVEKNLDNNNSERILSVDLVQKLQSRVSTFDSQKDETKFKNLLAKFL